MAFDLTNPAIKMFLPMIKPMVKGIDFSLIFKDIIENNGKIEIFELDSKIVFTTEADKKPQDLNAFVQSHLTKL